MFEKNTLSKYYQFNEPPAKPRLLLCPFKHLPSIWALKWVFSLCLEFMWIKFYWINSVGIIYFICIMLTLLTIYACRMGPFISLPVHISLCACSTMPRFLYLVYVYLCHFLLCIKRYCVQFCACLFCFCFVCTFQNRFIDKNALNYFIFGNNTQLFFRTIVLNYLFPRSA